MQSRSVRIWCGVWLVLAIVLVARATSRRESKGVILDHLEFGRRLWHGENGVGKSWRAAAVALALVESVSVRWVHWPSMMARLKDEVAGGGQLGALVAKLIGSPRILVVDELTGRRTEFEAETAERIIGPRAESGAVVITSNMRADDCRGYVGDRVWSRLGASCRIGEVGGVDRRRSP